MTKIRIPIVLLLFSMVTLTGSYFDIWWHMMGYVENFFTIPHLIIYLSVACGGVVVAYILASRIRRTGSCMGEPDAYGLLLVAIGCLLQLTAGIADYLYHEAVGFDNTLWSPPHLMGLYGGVLYVFGVTELFTVKAVGRSRAFFCVMSLGVAAGFYQFGLIEYDIQKDFSLHIRWEPYTPYYSLLLTPMLAFCFHYCAQKLQLAGGKFIALTAFVLSVCAWYAWSLTPVHLYFPTVIILGGALFDLVYTLCKTRTSYAIYWAASSMGIGLNVAVYLRSPLAFTYTETILSGLASVLAALLTIYLLRRFEQRQEHQYMGSEA